MTETNSDDAAWLPPGRGEWIRLADHFDRPWTAEYERIFRPTFRAGGAAYLHEYGIPVRMIDVQTVHGYPYLHPVPLVGPDSDRAAPAALIRLLARVVPAMRRCEHSAMRALRERPWLARAEQWWRRDRPLAISANRARAAIDIAALDHPALADHLEDCERLVIEGYRTHFELHGTDMLPIGLFLDACSRWGIDLEDALGLVVNGGAEPRAVRLDPDDLADTIISGYDIDRPRLCELPASIRDTVVAHNLPPVRTQRERVDEIVPRERRAEFDLLLGDARTVFPVRDDNGVILGAWRMGLLRRAYLAAGERLAASGAIADSSHAIEAVVPELSALLRATGATVPIGDLRARAAERVRWAGIDAPLRLGPELELPFHALPPSMRVMSGAQLILRDLIERGAAPALKGLGIGTDAGEGTARVTLNAEDAIARLEPGDVLIVRATSPAFNAVLPLAAALVTEHGGAISHAAVAARELGIPAVVGVRNVTDQITDGARVRVDGANGTVTVIAGAAAEPPGGHAAPRAETQA